MSKKTPHFAVILSGCGVFDGSEIHEAVMTLLAIDRLGGKYQCFAPNMPQHHVINHITGHASGIGDDDIDETRNVLVESARIARGEVLDLANFNASEFDGIIFPGGFGAAKNLCTFALNGANCSVNKYVRKAIMESYKARKVIGALCIAPALIAKVFGDEDICVHVTIGEEKTVAKGIENMGGKHEARKSGEVCVDEENRIVTSPCYMSDKTISQIADSAHSAVQAMVKLI